jgi:hypothetical protein
MNFHENTSSHAPLFEHFMNRLLQYSGIHCMRETSFIFTSQLRNCHAQ